MGLINLWHEHLSMPKYDEAWHRQDIADEFLELQEAEGLFRRWSELSDVVYTYTRSRWAGHRIERPVGVLSLFIGLLYMFPKYTLRWCFYRLAGRRTDPTVKLHVVRNPKKIEKLRVVAKDYQLDPERFEQECKKLLSYWPLLD